MIPAGGASEPVGHEPAGAEPWPGEGAAEFDKHPDGAWRRSSICGYRRSGTHHWRPRTSAPNRRRRNAGLQVRTPVSCGSAMTGRTPAVVRLDELFVRSARGDPAAFAALYEETAERAYGLSLRVLRDRRLAEDAVQEAYLSMWQQAARFDPSKGSSLGWIFMIVHRVAIDHVRAVGRRAARDDRHVREQWGGGSVSDPTHDQAWASIEARTVRDAWATSHHARARRFDWPTSTGTPSPRSRTCSGFPSVPRSPAFATVLSG